MDKELENNIRERAYELWMRNGTLPDRADEYWYQAEQEILGQSSEGSGIQPPSLIDPAPLGMTSMTADEAPPAAPKTRKKRSTAQSPKEETSAAPAAPKRRRTTKIT
ncbi:DUF2934 domain-containing protein [Microvirga sp. CF3062]|uniref:DUF2934 domain-containing protein n=1 Tax=Microvirga sp. CF3062 TaxID=3110182 RepID=UPI002E77DC8B|nr:DUF2934 domain-containing protein [Microvirga sp. CF3062]MEE1657145.1 DUF2934 domain-containing protein [Microvirga sp. CF3062]